MTISYIKVFNQFKSIKLESSSYPLCVFGQYYIETFVVMAPKLTKMFSILSYFVIFFASFYVLKARPLTPDGISNTLDYIDFYDEIKELFIYSSMHLFQQDHCFKKIVTYNHQNISLFTTLLLLCRDIETCPGPVTLSVCKCRGT